MRWQYRLLNILFKILRIRQRYLDDKEKKELADKMYGLKHD